MWAASSKAKRLRGYDGDEFGEIMICQPIRQERADGVSRTGVIGEYIKILLVAHRTSPCMICLCQNEEDESTIMPINSHITDTLNRRCSPACLSACTRASGDIARICF